MADGHSTRHLSCSHELLQLSLRFQEGADLRGDYEIASVMVLIQRYIDCGQYLSHGEAEFNAEGLLRLAGWEQDF